MIVPYVVSYSMMWGSVISWGIMWPLLSRKEGDWYAAGYQDGDFRGLSGYKVGPCWVHSESQCFLPCFGDDRSSTDTCLPCD